MAATLRQCLDRPKDFLARYGGEEFCCILPETDSGGAKKVAQRMIDAVRALGIEHNASKTANVLTISIGITVSAEVLQPKPPASALVKVADDCLYKAKEAGRGRLVIG